MSDTTSIPFLEFLKAGIARGGFATEDLLAAILPLMKQVRAAHEAGFVAPLDGPGDLSASPQGHLAFAPARVRSPEKNSAAIEALQSSAASALDVVANPRVASDLGQGPLTGSDRTIGAADVPVTRPAFLTGYRSWEQALGHHDELTDIYSLGMLLGSLACPLEEAIPALYRSPQVVIVGDEMQLPPTTFFAATRSEPGGVVVEEEGERIEVDLDSDSFLTHSSQNLSSTLLAWHYRSRFEALISFSNAAFYSGNLFTIPDRQCALPLQSEIRVTAPGQAAQNVDLLLARSISFHFMERGVYQDRTNPAEASYIARLVQGLLLPADHLSIGIVAFSEAQQAEIESALHRLAEDDPDFAARLEAEFGREENDVFCGLFVKNLENVQGDERDIILMSVCYGHDPAGRLLMNFGPINQRGGEKRLNVIFSRAKQHMAIVSSLRHHEITNDYNDGANSLKNFLHYAEAVSAGDAATARRVLENLNPLAQKALAPASKGDAVIEALATALRTRGHTVELNVGQSRFRCDVAIRAPSDTFHRLGILVDTDSHYANLNLLDRYLMQPSILRAFGWRFALVLTKDWYHNPDDVLERIEKILEDNDPGRGDKPLDQSVADAAPARAENEGRLAGGVSAKSAERNEGRLSAAEGSEEPKESGAKGRLPAPASPLPHMPTVRKPLA